MLFTYEISLPSSVNRDDAVMRDVSDRVQVLGFLGLCHCLVSSISDDFAGYFFPLISHKFEWILTSLTKELLSFSLAGNINKRFDEWCRLIVNPSSNKKEEICHFILGHIVSLIMLPNFTKSSQVKGDDSPLDFSTFHTTLIVTNGKCSLIDYCIERQSQQVKKEMELVVILDCSSQDKLIVL